MFGLVYTLYLCICVIVYLYICVFYILYTGMSYFIYLNPKLFKNIAMLGLLNTLESEKFEKAGARICNRPG